MRVKRERFPREGRGGVLASFFCAVLFYVPAVDEFCVAVLGVAVVGIDFADGALAPHMRVIEIGGDIFRYLPVGADIDKRSQRGKAVAGASGVSEDLVVVSAAARIPKVLSGGQLQPVQIGAQGEFADGLLCHLDECIGAVHEVIERYARIDARCGENLEESVVGAVRRIVVTSASEPSSAEPGTACCLAHLIATFDGSGAGAMIERAPTAVL